MARSPLQKKTDSSRCSLSLFAITCVLIVIGTLMILINLMWVAVIFLAFGACYYGLRAQTLDINRLAYRLRLFIYKIL